MAISKTDTKYEVHKSLGAKDVLKDSTPLTQVSVTRVTSKTGEQFHMDCPIYGDDTREEINERMGMFLSIIQDRLEEENAAWNEIEEEQLKKRLIKEATKRNKASYEKQKAALDKRVAKKKITVEQYEAEVAELKTTFETANTKLAEPETAEGIVEVASEQGLTKAPPEVSATH
jgi:hypothetical protein